jgi:hypothetical protein
MPPIGFFTARQRPKGLEFGACAACNEGTRAADLVAAYVSRIGPNDVAGDRLINEAVNNHPMLNIRAPGFLGEFFRPQNRRYVWLRNSAGVLVRKVEFRANGPLLRAYLRVFSAKLGMALYREHVGVALPIDGGVETYSFLNAGLVQEVANAWLKILPASSRLVQGQKTSDGQFAYRWNSDEKSLTAIFAQFHEGLYVGAFAAAQPEKWGFPTRIDNSNFVRPGELVQLMPGSGAGANGVSRG